MMAVDLAYVCVTSHHSIAEPLEHHSSLAHQISTSIAAAAAATHLTALYRG